jgi:Cu(I)/Ag(I) efflux system membrane fusion protein
MKKYINKRDIKLIGITLIAGLFFGWVFFHSSSNETTHNHEQETVAEETVYTCSMHPQIKQNKPGLCPICAMDLVPMATSASEGEHVDPNEIQMTKSALALASVQTTIVKQGIPEKNVQLLGKVKADERNVSQLTARFGGRIEKLFINYTGQQVRKGEKLGTIYSPELITAQKELLEAMKYKTSNPSFYKATRSKLKLWDLTEEQIDDIETRGETKTFFDIQSPISGTVTKRHVSIGDYVKEGSALFEVINLSKVWVMFDAYESDLPWIKKGDNIEFTLQSVPGKQFNGKVTFIDPFIDAQTRVAQVRIELKNFDGQLKPEMFANGILKSNTAQNTNELLIPKSAILWTGKRAVVYVKVPDRETSSFIYRQIVLGPEAGNFYVVSEGLSEGEEIVMNGVFKIDAAAQLAGKSSMMNPDGGKVSTGHNHGAMEMDSKKQPAQSQHSEIEMNPKNEHAGHEMEANIEHAIFKVSGNCEMCKSTIEEAVKSLNGVNVADWNVETKQMHVSFNIDKVSLDKIHKTIAAAGYDTEKVKGDDNAYDKLPECCQYTRE